MKKYIFNVPNNETFICDNDKAAEVIGKIKEGNCTLSDIEDILNEKWEDKVRFWWEEDDEETAEVFEEKKQQALETVNNFLAWNDVYCCDDIVFLMDDINLQQWREAYGEYLYYYPEDYDEEDKDSFEEYLEDNGCTKLEKITFDN